VSRVLPPDSTMNLARQPVKLEQTETSLVRNFCWVGIRNDA
jgi:hypothetical protein